MTMEVNRDVILDLLPLYLEGEGSPSTRALVEHFLQSDPELARMVKQPDFAEALKSTPLPIAKDSAMENYKEARRWMAIRTIGLAVIIAVVVLMALCLATAVYLRLTIGLS
jgi:anti-sigma factor RsiW